MFYNILIIIYLLRLLNLFKIDSWKYLLFVASCLYMWICVYISAGFGYPFGFRVSVRVSDIRGFGFGDGFPPESVFEADSGFDFRFRFWVHGDSTRSEPDPLPSLDMQQQQNTNQARVSLHYGYITEFKFSAHHKSTNQVHTSFKHTTIHHQQRSSDA